MKYTILIAAALAMTACANVDTNPHRTGNDQKVANATPVSVEPAPEPTPDFEVIVDGDTTIIRAPNGGMFY